MSIPSSENTCKMDWRTFQYPFFYLAKEKHFLSFGVTAISCYNGK